MTAMTEESHTPANGPREGEADRRTRDRPSGERIIVALDASPQSLAALRAASEIAELLDVELEGLFVEDINLLYLSALPFGHEIGSYTAQRRRLESRGLERQLRTIAELIQQSMGQVAAQRPSLRWSFRVRRGPVVRELLSAADEAALVGLGRAGRGYRRTMGSTAQKMVEQSRCPLLILGENGRLIDPFTVVYTGSPAAQRALALGMRFVQGGERRLRVLLWNPKSEPGELESAVQETLGDVKAEIHHIRAANILHALQLYDEGTLILPGDWSRLVAEHEGPAILVP